MRSGHTLIGKAWQTVSWLVVREATEEATKAAVCGRAVGLAMLPPTGNLTAFSYGGHFIQAIGPEALIEVILGVANA